MPLEEERLDEPIEVIFYFGIDEKRPIRFRRGDEVIRIATAKGYWRKRQGATQHHFWAVTDHNGDYYELEMDADHLDWRLTRIVYAL